MQSQAASTVRRPSPLFMMPPPLMFGLAFALGSFLQHLMPLSFLPRSGVVFNTGAAVLVVGIVLSMSLAVTFLLRRTTLNPFADPSALVAWGPYRFTRNPMYVSLVVAYLGGVLMTGSIWPLLTLLLPLAILDRVVIPFEESRLTAVFGQAYRQYAARVRRWI